MAKSYKRDDKKKPAGEALKKEASDWLARIRKSEATEKTWMDDAADAVAVYTGEKATDTLGVSLESDFNILFSNVETIVPATINSPPAPDIRRRFAQDDDVAGDFAEMLERSMRVQVDDGRLQVEMEGMAQDGFLAGRGLIRLRFKSEFVKDELSSDAIRDADEEAGEDEDGKEDAEDEQEADERVTSEAVCFEAVSWRDFRHGPAKRWGDVPWMAFRHSIPREDIDAFADSFLVDQQIDDDKTAWGEDQGDLFVWEIWIKKSRTVIFVTEGKVRLIKRVEDPLGLTKFFPIHDPVQAIEVTGRLMPVNPFSIYRNLADELSTTTRRIASVTKQLKVKGAYAGGASDLKAMLDADNNEFVPIEEADIWAQNGGLDKAIVFWPVERLVMVLRELYAVRDQTKAAIYEITGISDIVRGASNSNETATAQNIKSQWGSLRIQKMQRQIERAARELFNMMAEIIPSKFSPETLQKMTNVQLIPSEQDMQPIPQPQPPQLPPGMPPEQAQQVQQQFQQAAGEAKQAEDARQKKLAHLGQLQAMMKERVNTYFRVDVETDSTVKADLTRQKQEATEFMGAASQYFAAVSPIIGQGALSMEVAVEIFASFSRLFNLGKSVEDALEKALDAAREKAKQPPQPSPEQMQAEAEGKTREAEAAAKAKEYDFRMAELAKKAETDAQSADIGLKTKNVDLQIKGIDLSMKKIDQRMKEIDFLRPEPVQPATF